MGGGGELPPVLVHVIQWDCCSVLLKTDQLSTSSFFTKELSVGSCTPELIRAGRT